MSVRKGNKIIAGSYAVVKPEVYTKVETDDLLNQKQDKLIAGNNIFIDENNVISSSGGGGSFINVVQETGDSTEDVMSQASVTHELEQKANTIDLADVSLSGDYEDLSNTPDLSVYTKTEDLAEIAFTADYEDLGNTPDLSVYAKNEELSKVATTNNYNDLDNKPNLELYDTTISVNNKLSLKQDLLTAGEGISIEGNTISSTVNSAEWGNIIGDIANQADLQNVIQERLNGKIGIDFDNITEEGVKKLANIIGTGDYMFDTRLVDHVLTYEQTKGWALQGTYVYKEAVAGSRYGYPDFYNKCVEEFENSSNSQAYIKSNVTLVGALRDNQGLLSGFYSSNYATLPNHFLTAVSNADSWEAEFKFTTGSSVSSPERQIIFHSGVGSATVGKSGFTIDLYQSKLRVSYSPPSSTGDTVSINASSNTQYFVKANFDVSTSTFNAYYKLNESDDWTLIGTSTVAERLAESSDWNTTEIGCPSASTDYYFNGGSVDLNGCYINIDGQNWWKGVDNLEYKTNTNGHMFYNIAQKEQVDELYNTNGIAWYYGVDTENERIFLPRTRYYAFTGGVIGNGMTLGLTTGSDFGGLTALTASGSLKGSMAPYGKTVGTTTVSGQDINTNKSYGITTDPTKSGITLETDDSKYLYICVGNTVADTSFVDVVTQVENGVKDIDDAVNDGVLRLNSIDSLKTTQITNCLLEVPQRIKLELNEGVLTLKAGSQVIVPNGFEADGVTPRFDCVDIDSDKTYVLNYSTTDKIVLMWDLKYSVLGTERFSIMSSGTTPSNYDQYGTWYDTNANVVKYTNDSGATWISSRSLPIAILDTDGASTITSINQTFNGFGYIGSTVWVDKGVKGLIPNGRNEDGTLNNIEYTTSKVAIRDVGLTNTDCTYALVTSNRIVDYRKLVVSETQPTTTYTLWYKPSENILYTTRNTGEPVQVVLGVAVLDCYRTSTTISNFNPKQPFRAVDWSDGIRITETYVNGTSWYRVYSDGWCDMGGKVGGTSVSFLIPFTSLPTVSIGITTISGSNSFNYNTASGMFGNSLTVNGFNCSQLGQCWRACGYIR